MFILNSFKQTCPYNNKTLHDKRYFYTCKYIFIDNILFSEYIEVAIVVSREFNYTTMTTFIGKINTALDTYHLKFVCDLFYLLVFFKKDICYKYFKKFKMSEMKCRAHEQIIRCL